MTAATTEHLDPNSLVCRTAAQIYLASMYGKTKFVPYEEIHPVELARFERMARAALTEALREPVTA